MYVYSMYIHTMLQVIVKSPYSSFPLPKVLISKVSVLKVIRHLKTLHGQSQK